MIRNKIALILTLLPLSMVSCQAQTPLDQSKTVEIDGGDLFLEGKNLTFKGQTVSLNIPEPTQFSVDRQGKPDVYEVSDGYALVVMCIQKTSNHDCQTDLQGVFIKNNKIYLSPTTQRIAHCDDGPMDRKIFEIFTYSILNHLR